VADIRELHETFFPSADGLDKSAGVIENESPSGEDELARALGINKRATAEAPLEKHAMKSLASIYNDLNSQEKRASAAHAPTPAMEKKAEAMARAELQKEAEIQKTAAEYDAAGRIMARGFMDEFLTKMAEIEGGTAVSVPGQADNDIDPARAAIPTTGSGPKMENAELNSAEGVKGKLGPAGAPAILTVRSMGDLAADKGMS